MERKKIIFAIILCLAVILAAGCKSGVGNITGSVASYEKTAGNDTKEDTISNEIEKEQK